MKDSLSFPQAPFISEIAVISLKPLEQEKRAHDNKKKKRTLIIYKVLPLICLKTSEQLS
jgi:hypothetical protein